MPASFFASLRARRPIARLTFLILASLLVAGLLPGRAQWLTLANPNWNITLTDSGYSDFLLDNTPGFQGREYLSGEWGAAVGYQVTGQPAVTPQWLEPQFAYPDWLTGSPFHVVTPLTALGVNADNLPVAESVIANDDLRIRLHFEMIDTVLGTPMGTTPASSSAAPTSILSDRYVMKQTATIQNLAGQPISQLQFFQFLHGLHSQRGLYDDRPEAGALADYQFDTTLAGVDTSAVGPGSSADGLEDFIGFHARVAPTAFEVGHYGIEGNGIDDHWSAKPSDGVHRSIEDNWQTPPYSTRLGTDQFQPAQRWVSGAQRWDLGPLAPGQSVSFEVLLSIRTGTRVAPGTHLTGGCNGGSVVPGGLDYDFAEVTAEGACFGKYSQADETELAVRVAAGEIVPLDFPTPGGPTQLWDLSFSGAFAGAVQLTFGYDATALPAGLDELDLGLYHFEGGVWQPLAATVNPVTHTVTVTPDPAEAGSASGSGAYAAGTQATVTATAAPGFVFAGWIEGAAVVSSSPSLTFAVAGDRTLTAHFIPVTGGHAIATASLPAHGGTTSGDGSYALGSTATVTATPAPGYKFSKWLENGVVVSTTARYSFAVGGDRALTAKFKPVYTLTLTVEPDGTGEVEGDPFYELGELAKLKAKPNAGYAFVGWYQNGLLVSDEPNFQFNMTGNKELKGRFEAGFRVDTSSVPPHAGTTAGGGVHPAGASITLVATPAPGYVFLYWSAPGAPEIAVSTSADYTYIPTLNETLVAQFGLGPEIAVEQPDGTDLTSGVAEVDFGALGLPAGTATLSFTIRNLGPQWLSLGGATISGADPNDFTFDPATLPAGVPANGSALLEVTFTPQAAGLRTATLEILSDDPDESPFLVGLLGTGEAPPPTAARLDHFRAVATGPGRVELNWRTLVEVLTAGFLVERQVGNGAWEPVAGTLMPAMGNALRPQSYAATDLQPASAPHVTYRLVELDRSGQRIVMGTAPLLRPVPLSIERGSDALRVQLQGTPSTRATIQSAPSLTGPWNLVDSLTLDASGWTSLLLPSPTTDTIRFYRAFAE